jgi:hypothetical protein
MSLSSGDSVGGWPLRDPSVSKLCVLIAGHELIDILLLDGREEECGDDAGLSALACGIITETKNRMSTHGWFRSEAENKQSPGDKAESCRMASLRYQLPWSDLRVPDLSTLSSWYYLYCAQRNLEIVPFGMSLAWQPCPTFLSAERCELLTAT